MRSPGSEGNYLPELSFGTHFFQDLVEASIRYLLSTRTTMRGFNEIFLQESSNVLQELLPEFAHLEDTLRVIDVPRENNGLILRVLMNADIDQAVGFLSSPLQATVQAIGSITEVYRPWRKRTLALAISHGAEDCVRR